MTTRFRHIDDWTTLVGMEVVMTRNGVTDCIGRVDLVTEDGNMLWLHPHVGTRRIYEKPGGCDAWVDDNDHHLGFHYRVTSLQPKSDHFT